MSANTEAANQDSGTDAATKEEEKESHASEGCTDDSTCSSSMNDSSQKLGNSNTCVKSAANGHLMNFESTALDTKDNVPDKMEIDVSTSVSGTDVNSLCGDGLKSDTADDTHDATQCSALSAEQSNTGEDADVMQSPPNEKCSDTDAEAQSSAAVCDNNEHKADTSSESKLEQTDWALSDESRDWLQSREPDRSLHRDSHEKIGTDSASDAHPDVSPSLMNEVNVC